MLAAETSILDRFLGACGRADRATAQRLLAEDPGLLDRLGDEDRAEIVHAADLGHAEAVRLMLDLGFGPDIHGRDGATPLHAAVFSGSAEVVRLLAARGADLNARDHTFGGTALSWAAVGSGERSGHNPDPDWVATVRALIDAGAATDHNPWVAGKPPDDDVAALLLSLGIRPE